MSDVTNIAIERLNRELKAFGSKDKKADVIKMAVHAALVNFAQQDDEFAQAIAQAEVSLSDCCSSIVKGSGNSLSDLDAYRKAVQFYFPGAEIRFEMEIDLIGDAGSPGARPTGGLVLNLEDFI